MSKLIVTADDYGAHNYIDAGINRALQKHKISSVACFVVFKDSPERVRRLMELKEELKETHRFGVGLHFSISAGFPLIQAKSMMAQQMDDGTFRFKGPSYYPYDSFKKSDLRAFREELRAQIYKLQEILGAEPIDSISNHHGIAYVAPALFEAYIETISEFKIPVRSPLTWTRSGLLYGSYDGKPLPPIAREGIKLGTWRSLILLGPRKLKAHQAMAIMSGLPTTFCLADIIYGQPYPENIMNLLEEYNGSEMSTEFMMHLGHSPENILPTDVPHGIDPGYFQMRSVELETLLGVDFKTYANAPYNINVSRFRELTLDDYQSPVK